IRPVTGRGVDGAVPAGSQLARRTPPGSTLVATGSTGLQSAGSDAGGRSRAPGSRVARRSRPAWLDIASGSRGMEMRHRARWCVLLMWLAAGVAQAAGMAEVRKQVEATMLVTGRVTITLEGTVRDWTIDQRDKLPPAVANVIDAAAPGWRFEPILLDGKPAHGSARMSLLMVAERVDADRFRVSIRSGYFGREAVSVAARHSGTHEDAPTEE